MIPAIDAPIGTAPAAPIVPADVRSAAAADVTIEAANDRSVDATIVTPIDYDAEARDLVEFTWSMISPLYPSLTPIYTLEARSNIARAAAPLMRKYGFDLGRLGPELNFAIVILPLVAPTVQAIRHDRQKQAQTSNGTTERKPSDATTAGPADDRIGVDPAQKPDESPLVRFPGQADT